REDGSYFRPFTRFTDKGVGYLLKFLRRSLAGSVLDHDLEATSRPDSTHRGRRNDPRDSLLHLCKLTIQPLRYRLERKALISRPFFKRIKSDESEAGRRRTREIDN